MLPAAGEIRQFLCSMRWMNSLVALEQDDKMIHVDVAAEDWLRGHVEVGVRLG
jgi:hypothetical protein